MKAHALRTVGAIALVASTVLIGVPSGATAARPAAPRHTHDGFDVAAALATRPAGLAGGTKHSALLASHRSVKTSVSVVDNSSDASWAEGDLTAAKMATDNSTGVPSIIGTAWVDPAAWTDPHSTEWTSAATYLAWWLDVNNDGVTDYYLLFVNDLGTLTADIYDKNLTWKCAGDWDYNAAVGGYAAAAPLGCVGNPVALKMRTKMAYEVSGTQSIDFAPDSAWTASMANDIRPTKPAPPTTPASIAGHGSVTATWPAVANPPGAPVTDYIVQYSAARPVAWTTFADGVSSTPRATVTGLSNHQQYIVRVAAKNRLGTSAFSSASVARTPLVPVVTPSAPSKPFGVAGDGRITFEWVAPAIAGTTAVTDYVVESSTNNAPWTTRADGVSTATTVSIGGLSASSGVRLRVAARSSSGQGPWSPTSDVTRPFTTPGVPTGVAATPLDGALSVSWLPPVSNGGSAIRSYTVRYQSTVTKSIPISTRIVGGTAAKITDVPWQVEVELGNGTELCGGTLVDAQWVVTAAHCASGQAPSAVKVHSGITYRSAMTATNAISVDRVITHPGWNNTTKQNDIALLHLAAPAPGGVPVPLFTNAAGPAAGTAALVSGWGTTSSNAPFAEDQLRRATVRVLAGPTDACGTYVQGVDFFPDVMLCAGSSTGGIDTCQGDSGGPMVINVGGVWMLAGATSWGDGCAQVDRPGVYTRITTFVNWIQAYVSATWPSVTVSCTVPNCTHVTIPSLTNANTVRVQVIARNTYGNSTASTVAGPFVIGAGSHTVPGAPQHVVAEPKNHRVRLTWSAPADTGGTAVLDYRISDGATTRLVGSGVRSYDVTNLANGVAVTYTVAAINVVGSGASSAPTAAVKPGISTYVSRSGVRLMDTRSTGTTADGLAQRTGVIRVAAPRTVHIGGRAGIPTTVRAVAVNVLVPSPALRGALTLWACGGTRPGHPNVHYQAGVDSTMLVVTALSTTGTLCIATTTPVHVVLDAQGYFPTAAVYATVPTARLASGTRSAGSTLRFNTTRRGGVPAKVTAVVLKVTAESVAKGVVTVYPCTARRTSSVSLSTGDRRIVDNLVVIAPSAAGTLCLYSSATAAVSVDVVGYLAPDAQYTAVAPRRLVDSRSGGATVDGLYARIGGRAAKAGLAVKVLGRASTPAEASTVAVTITVIAPTMAGTLRVAPCGGSTTGINISYAAGQTVTNTVISHVGTAGKVCVASSVATDLVIDLVGWFPKL